MWPFSWFERKRKEEEERFMDNHPCMKRFGLRYGDNHDDVIEKILEEIEDIKSDIRYNLVRQKPKKEPRNVESWTDLLVVVFISISTICGIAVVIGLMRILVNK